MRHIQVQIDYDDGDPDWFLLSEFNGDQQVDSAVLASQGFQLHHLEGALTAMGHARVEGKRILLESDLQLTAVRDMVAEMFEYFTAPDVPTADLLQIQATVGAAANETEDDDLKIPLFACAWLDITVRNDLANEARSDPHLWSRQRLELNVADARQARVSNLIKRLRLTHAPPAAGRMAPSGRRRAADERPSQTG